jgi:negative modulator of initiation of replication
MRVRSRRGQFGSKIFLDDTVCTVVTVRTVNSKRQLTLEVDVFDYIMNKVAESDDSASTFLRQRLDIGLSTAHSETPVALPALDELFSSTEFRYAKGVVGRFLVLLSWLHRRHSGDFGEVVAIRGRGRLYFARSARELEDAGTHVNPKQIPNSPYWVITTSPTDLKQIMIGSVMKVLGYEQADIRRAQSEIARESERKRFLDSL